MMAAGDDQHSGSIVALVADLIFQSKLQAAAAGAGVPLTVVRTAEQFEQAVGQAIGVVLDLAIDGVDGVRLIHIARSGRPQLKIVGFLPHVEVDLATAARAAGADEVLPRSAFAANLPKLLSALAAPPPEN
jgi:CheY-like chemotaxis protein